jgi:hypothetical protein
LLHGLLRELLVAEVARDGDRAPPFAFDDLLGLGRVIMFAKIDNGDVGALASEERSDRAADAAVAARD